VRIRLCLLLAVLMFFTASLYAAASLTRVRTFATNTSLRLVLELNQKANYRYFLLDKPERLVIDIKQAQVLDSIRLPSFNDKGFVEDIRVGKRAKGVVRVVLDLRDEAKVSSFSLPKKSEKPDRIVFDIKHPTIKKATSTAVKKAVVVKKASSTPLRNVVVVIDPGHGGKDPGGTGRRGTKEKNVVLALAKYLAAEINKTPGMEAKLTRTGDYFVSLRGRLKLARKYRADAFIAIHADIFKQRSARGASVFALSKRGATSEAARWLAKKENESELMGGVDLSDKSRLLQSVLLDLSQNMTINRSVSLGEDVLFSLDRVARLHHKRVEQARFVVLKAPDVPSILVETGFLSNQHEENLLRQRSYQKKVAKSLYRGIKKYVYAYPPAHSKILSWVRQRSHTYVVRRGDNLSTIAERFNVSVEKVRSLNALTSDKLLIGQKLKV
jgi:N-acetylmuramoyl-L-alanine amidase